MSSGNYESVFDNGAVRLKLADTEDGIALSLDFLDDGEPTAGTTLYIGKEQIDGMCAWLEKYRTPTVTALAMEGAPTIKDAILRVMRDHYWDSLEPQKELVLKHIEGAMRRLHSV